jgi:AraC family transcriptional regulator, transcriptional activator of pobA
MPPKAQIPKYGLTHQAKKDVLIVDLEYYEDYKQHAVEEPHTDDHFTMLVIETGRIELIIDFETVRMITPTFLLIAPEQIHRLVGMDKNRGWLINIDAAVLPNDLRVHMENHLGKPISLPPESAITVNLFSLIRVAANLNTQTVDVFIERAVRAALNGALMLAVSAAQFNETVTSASSRGVLIYSAFRKLLELHFKSWKQTSDYAMEMAISSSHLNDSVKEFSGSPVSVHIQERNILEAKRLLYNTMLTASEIGYQLGYEDPVYFGKLFKKHTRLTPLAFRSKFRK